MTDNQINNTDNVEDGEYWFEEILPSGETLVISTISNKTAEEADCDFCDGWGYYITLWPKEPRSSRPRVLAKMVDEEAAKDLWLMIKRKL